MEPLAPGTEGDRLYTQVSRLSRKETAEQQALSKQAFLRNGRYDTIFELNYVQGTQIWHCRICNCPVLGKLFNHETGKRHKANLGRHCSNRTTESDATSGGGGTQASIKVAPGEPVPPGFEEEVEEITVKQQGCFEGFSAGPLIGLEYLLELLDYDPSKEPSYLCILCDKKGDPRTVLNHLSSYMHQVMYLQKHFPTVHRHIAPYMVKEFKRNWQAGLQKIAEAIEKTFGRLKPMPVEAGKFEKDRELYIQKVAKGKHFNELTGYTFENVVSKEDLTKVHEDSKSYDSNLPFRKAVTWHITNRKSILPPVVARRTKRQKLNPEVAKKKRSLSPMSDISSSDFEDFDVDKGRGDGWGRGPSPRRKEGPMPWQKADYGRSKESPPATTSEKRREQMEKKIEEFEKLSKAIDSYMDQEFEKHRRNPEKHPNYNKECKKFWNLRNKKLRTRGKNDTNSDSKLEWIEFWNERMLELHQEEIKTKKLSLRKRLGLPEEATPMSFKIGERKESMDPAERSNKRVPTTVLSDSDPEVIVIEDNDQDSVSSRGSSSKRSRRRSRTPLRGRDRSPQFRRRSPIGRRDSTSNKSSRRLTPSPRRRSVDNINSTTFRASPPKRTSPHGDWAKLRLSPVSPEPDRFVVSFGSKKRSNSRDRSRELSWERDRHRDYDDKHSYRLYRFRGGPAPWDSPPLSRERLYAPMDPYAPPKVMRDVTREPVHYLGPNEDDNEDVNVVGVLRMVTALEEKLGSLGPKVIELLGQALAMEKKTANSSETLLDNDINCVLFETVKEKLKGQLQAGLVDRIQEKAFKIAIRKTAGLIHMAGERKKQKEVELPKKPVMVPGIGTVEKGKIARQIANALIAQGKTDVTQDELEQLINAVVDLAETNKNSSQTMTPAIFLEQMNNNGGLVESYSDPMAKSTEDPPKQDQDEQSSMTTANAGAEQRTRKIEEDQDASNESQDISTTNMEGLSDSDLQTLLQNFKDLSTEEQLGLINYLKKLETEEAERVEKLGKFVNLTDNQKKKNERSSRYSYLSKETDSLNPASVGKESKTESKKDEKQEQSTSFDNIDSEEEDYSFEDVAKAASQKVIEKEMVRKLKEEENDMNLSDANALITSLLNSMTKGRPPASNTNEPAGSSSAPSNVSNILTSSSNAQLSCSEDGSSEELKRQTTPTKINVISNVSMTSTELGSTLGNVQNMTRQNHANSASSESVPDAAPNFRPYFKDFQTGRGTNRKPYDVYDIDFQREVRGHRDFPFNQKTGRPERMASSTSGELRYEMSNSLSRGKAQGRLCSDPDLTYRTSR